MAGNSTQEYAYYPGCSLHGTAKEYDVSVRLVCEKLGISLQELNNWVCCGASAAHSSNHLLSLALPAQTLKLMGDSETPLAVPCAMCFSRLKTTLHELKNPDIRDQVRQLIDADVNPKTSVKSMLEILADEQLSFSLTKPLNGLKVACYYGCLLVRPPSVTQTDDAENPQSMEGIMERLGAKPVEWGLKTSCCGAGMAIPKPEIVLKLSHNILLLAQASGADCVAVACPMCHANLDMHQAKMRSVFGDQTHLPVLFFTQLMGLAMGFSGDELQLQKHFTDPRPLLKEKGLL